MKLTEDLKEKVKIALNKYTPQELYLELLDKGALVRCMEIKDTDKVFFTSDWHLFHKNIIKYSNRPFKNLDEMLSTLIDNTNKVVGTDDTLVILGDFSFCSVRQSILLLEKIKCKNIVFCQGNHDQSKFMRRVCDIKDKNISSYSINQEFRFEINGLNFICKHIPLDEMMVGYFNIHGHIHTEGNYKITSPFHFDVGVDNTNFTPISLTEILTINNI